MTTTTTLLNTCIKRVKAAKVLDENLKKCFSITPGGACDDAVWGTMDEYIKLVAKEVGDTDGWLDWFIWENDCGASKLKAKAPSWKKVKAIRTIDDLEKLIKACASERNPKACPACGDIYEGELTVRGNCLCPNLACDVREFRVRR